MFTGLIQEIGKVVRFEQFGAGRRLTISAPGSAAELNVNDSIAVNGCCLTVVAKGDAEFSVEAVEETLKKTTIGMLSTGAPVNLELAMKLDARLGGHLVLGHVDGVGVVKTVKSIESSWLFTIGVPEEFLHYVIPVGSIAIDGVSLTVARILGEDVTVSIIPHTFEKTIFQYLKTGSLVNIEFDLIGKYVERLMMKDSTVGKKSLLTLEKLRAWGFGN